MTTTLSEIATITLFYHYSEYKNFKSYYQKHVKIHLNKEFPNAPSYSRMVELKQDIFWFLALFVQSLAARCTGRLLIALLLKFVFLLEDFVIKHLKDWLSLAKHDCYAILNVEFGLLNMSKNWAKIKAAKMNKNSLRKLKQKDFHQWQQHSRASNTSLKRW